MYNYRILMYIYNQKNNYIIDTRKNIKENHNKLWNINKSFSIFRKIVEYFYKLYKKKYHFFYILIV